VVAIYSVKAFGRKASFVWIYPFLVAFAGMYFNHHYIVDYVIGWIYLAVAYFVMDRVLMPRLFDRLVNYRRLRRSRVKNA
jgi:membrane-associated phospholipid phosphatase